MANAELRPAARLARLSCCSSRLTLVIVAVCIKSSFVSLLTIIGAALVLGLVKPVLAQEKLKSYVSASWLTKEENGFLARTTRTVGLTVSFASPGSSANGFDAALFDLALCLKRYKDAERFVINYRIVAPELDVSNRWIYNRRSGVVVHEVSNDAIHYDRDSNWKSIHMTDQIIQEVAKKPHSVMFDLPKDGFNSTGKRMNSHWRMGGSRESSG